MSDHQNQLAKYVNTYKEFDSVFFFAHDIHRREHEHKHNMTNIQLERTRVTKNSINGIKIVVRK